MNVLRKWVVAGIIAAVSSAGMAAQWHTIAVDDLGNAQPQSSLSKSAGNYRFKIKGLSDSQATVAYGDVVELVYKDIDPTALYQLKLQFVGDVGTRVQSVVVNGEVLKDPFPLKKGVPTDVVLDIPNSLASTGLLEVQVRKHAGPNAVLSYAELCSTEKQTLTQKKPEAAQRMEEEVIDTPRLSPIPTAVANVAELKQSLDGTWKFNPDPETDVEQLKTATEWSDIQVPGEWTMQGFNVETNKAAGYFRTFTVSKDWKSKRIKLRFDAVYSDAVVYVNGQEVGSHLGGFTPFELDVTDQIKLGQENILVLKVINESLADSLASGSKYACHPLGGIPRSVYLIALPDVNIASLAVRTSFDDAFRDATLQVLLEIANEQQTDVSDLDVQYELSPWGSDERIPLNPGNRGVQELSVGQTAPVQWSAPVKAPKKWDDENPNLYVLTCTLSKGGQVLETVRQRFGFRTSEVVGNQLFINGNPVKLRGVNRHEVYPTSGRSIPKEMYRKDVELFREANVNLLRTCHYPPDKALMEAADELGMLIECEGPFCWSQKTKGDSQVIREVTVRQSLEMVEHYRNHPSIIYWSIANESRWNDHFDAAGKAMAKLDPTRPITFNFHPWGKKNHKEDLSICAIGSNHYPGFGGAKKHANSERPINYGEFAHLNAYNRFELATDVALRDTWGNYLHRIWEGMYAAQGVLGGSIWAGIDDTFYWDFKNADGSVEARTVGYGTWGPIDGWRRKKPEWWGMKKVYSPIRIDKEKLRVSGSDIIVPIENRQNFSNLDRMKIHWEIGAEHGQATADIAPRSNGELVIHCQDTIIPGSELELTFDDPRGFCSDFFKFSLGETKEDPVVKTTEKYRVKKTGDQIVVTGKHAQMVINRKTGLFEDPKFKGPYLMVLPLNRGGNTQMHGPTQLFEPFTETCTEWNVGSVDVSMDKGMPLITVKGNYKEADGVFRYRFNEDGTFTVEYDFESTAKVNPRQLGIVFDLPRECENLSWKRKGYWSTYPEWHIARLEGTANASEGTEATPVGPRIKPDHEWRLDRTKIGSNDFASTKHNIYHASLLNRAGVGLEVLANEADRHVRAWIDADRIRLLVAYYSNGGSERFLRRLSNSDDQPLEQGGKISGSACLHLK